MEIYNLISSFQFLSFIKILERKFFYRLSENRDTAECKTGNIPAIKFATFQNDNFADSDTVLKMFLRRHVFCRHL